MRPWKFPWTQRFVSWETIMMDNENSNDTPAVQAPTGEANAAQRSRGRKLRTPFRRRRTDSGGAAPEVEARQAGATVAAQAGPPLGGQRKQRRRKPGGGAQ